MKFPHTIPVAIALSGLSEDELYFIIRFAGNLGYDEAIARLNPAPWHKKLRRKIIWVGGWEMPQLMQWDEGCSAWQIYRDYVEIDPNDTTPLWKRRIKRFFNSFCDVYPLTLFDVLTFNTFGITLSVNLWKLKGYLVLSRARVFDSISKLYWSPNGTPQHPDAKFLWVKKGTYRYWEKS